MAAAAFIRERVPKLGLHAIGPDPSALGSNRRPGSASPSPGPEFRSGESSVDTPRFADLDKLWSERARPEERNTRPERRSTGHGQRILRTLGRDRRRLGPSCDPPPGRQA